MELKINIVATHTNITAELRLHMNVEGMEENPNISCDDLYAHSV